METAHASPIVMPESVTRTAYVRVRHSATCRDRNKGPEHKTCRCRKTIFYYDSSVGPKTRKESAKTRDWSVAQAKAQDWLDQFDPDKVRIKRLEAEKAAKEGTATKIEVAIAKYIQDKAVRLRREPSTVTRAKNIFGLVDPQTFEVKRKGLFLKWLDTVSPRPVFVSDITPALVTDFLNTWAGYRDWTIRTNWTSVKNFFKFCRVMNWISISTAQDIETPPLDGEDSIAHFTDEEYSKILAAAKAQVAATVNDKGNSLSLYERQERQRLLTILELIRNSGMALVDATEFRRDSIDQDGVLTYWRKKTRKKARKPAVVLLPEHLLELIRTVPPANGTSAQPFRNSKVLITSDEGRWRRLFQRLCEDAGVKEVQTDAGPKRPHPHMLRHTFAVDMIRKPGATTRDVAIMLGDTEAIVEKTYLKFSSTLKDAHVEKMRQWIQRVPAAKPKQTEVVQMGGRRANR